MRFFGEAYLERLQLEEGEKVLALCYLHAVNDEFNKCLLTNERLIVVYGEKYHYFQLDHVTNITFQIRRSMAPLLMGGIVAPLSLLAIFKNVFDPWLVMIVFFLSLYSFYFGWLGHTALSVEEGKTFHDFILKSTSSNLRAFVEFTLKFIRKNRLGSSDEGLFIYHIAKETDWEAQKNAPVYKASSLLKEGFIHCSTKQQLESTVNRYFKDQSNLILLTIDPLLVTAEIKYEVPGHLPANPPPLSPDHSSGLFPHIYGPINANAIIKAEAFSG